MMYTKKNIEEYMKCRDDVRYFAENYIKISSPANGYAETNIRLNNYQIAVVDEYEKNRVFAQILPRQVGKSVVAAIILLHKNIFEDGQTAAIYAPNLDLSKNILDIIRRMIDELPAFLRPRLITDRKYSIEFENNSRMFALSSSNVLRGCGINMAYIDESEYVQNLSSLTSTMKPMLHLGGSTCFALSSSPMTKTDQLLKTVERDINE